MYRKILTWILLAVFLVLAACCSKNAGTGATETDESGRQAALENPLAIVDRDGNRLGQIDNCANLTCVDGGIFYSVFTLKEYSYTGTAEYRFFSLEDRKDYLFGQVEEQGYEAAFSRVELDGVIYTLAVKGNPAGSAAVPLLLLAFDTAEKTMQTYTVSEYGFPYAAMTVQGGKLLIMNHETTKEKDDKIYAFDPVTKRIEEVLSFPSSKDSLRGVCAAENGFYLLRLRINHGGENEMFIDLYDDAYGKVSEQSVQKILVNAIKNVRGITGRQDALNEIGMNVSRFYIADGRYMIYENFGLSRIAADLETGETILAKDDTYAVSTGSGNPLICKLDYDADAVSDPVIFSMKDGELANLSFVPDREHRMIQAVSVSAGGVIAILASDAFPMQKGTGVLYVLAAQ